MNLSFPRSALIVMHKCLKNSASRRLCNGSASFACACRRSLHSSYRSRRATPRVTTNLSIYDTERV